MKLMTDRLIVRDYQIWNENGGWIVPCLEFLISKSIILFVLKKSFSDIRKSGTRGDTLYRVETQGKISYFTGKR